LKVFEGSEFKVQSLMLKKALHFATDSVIPAKAGIFNI